VANNILFSLTINLRGEISSFGQTTLQRLHGELQFFSLNMDGLVRDDWACVSAQEICSTSTALSIHVSSATLDEVSEIFSRGQSITDSSVIFQNHADQWRQRGYCLGKGLAQTKSLTSFNLTVYSNEGVESNLGFSLSRGWSSNKSLTSFTLTVHDYVDASGDWGIGLGVGLSNSKSLPLFTLTVDGYADSSGVWGIGWINVFQIASH